MRVSRASASISQHSAKRDCPPGQFSLATPLLSRGRQRTDARGREAFQTGFRLREPVSLFVAASRLQYHEDSPTRPLKAMGIVDWHRRSQAVPGTTRRHTRRNSHCLAARSLAVRPLLLRPHSPTTAFQTPGRPDRAPVTTPAAVVAPVLVLTSIQSFTSLADSLQRA
jgi:hypothetical protein